MVQCSRAADCVTSSGFEVGDDEEEEEAAGKLVFIACPFEAGGSASELFVREEDQEEGRRIDDKRIFFVFGF